MVTEHVSIRRMDHASPSPAVMASAASVAFSCVEPSPSPTTKKKKRTMTKEIGTRRREIDEGELGKEHQEKGRSTPNRTKQKVGEKSKKRRDGDGDVAMQEKQGETRIERQLENDRGKDRIDGAKTGGVNGRTTLVRRDGSGRPKERHRRALHDAVSPKKRKIVNDSESKIICESAPRNDTGFEKVNQTVDGTGMNAENRCVGDSAVEMKIKLPSPIRKGDIYLKNRESKYSGKNDATANNKKLKSPRKDRMHIILDNKAVSAHAKVADRKKFCGLMAAPNLPQAPLPECSSNGRDSSQPSIKDGRVLDNHDEETPFDRSKTRNDTVKMTNAAENNEKNQSNAEIIQVVGIPAAADDIIEEPWMGKIVDVPAYAPTEEEWSNPSLFIRNIAESVQQFGMCLIRPPVASNLRMYGPQSRLHDMSFTTEFQDIKAMVESQVRHDSKEDSEKTSPSLYSVKNFKDQAYRNAEHILQTSFHLPARMLESIYWHFCRSCKKFVVQQSKEIEDTAFAEDDALGNTNWNLNKLSMLPESSMRWLPGPVPGISSPKLRIGAMFSTTKWHISEHFLYSIYFHHVGESKIWYGVPASDAAKFEAAVANTRLANLWKELETSGKPRIQCADAISAALTRHEVSFSPQFLYDRGIQVYRAVQEPGTFVVTFPRCYHCGFNTGFSIIESLNFSLSPQWFRFSGDARRFYRRIKEQNRISDEYLLFCEANKLSQKLQAATLNGDEEAICHLAQENKELMTAFIRTFESIQKKIELLVDFGAFKRIAKCPRIPNTVSDVQRDSKDLLLVECGHCLNHCYLSSVYLDSVASSALCFPANIDLCVDCVASRCARLVSHLNRQHASGQESARRTKAKALASAKGATVFIKETLKEIEMQYELMKNCSVYLESKDHSMSQADLKIDANIPESKPRDLVAPSYSGFKERLELSVNRASSREKEISISYKCRKTNNNQSKSDPLKKPTKSKISTDTMGHRFAPIKDTEIDASLFHREDSSCVYNSEVMTSKENNGSIDQEISPENERRSDKASSMHGFQGQTDEKVDGHAVTSSKTITDIRIHRGKKLSKPVTNIPHDSNIIENCNVIMKPHRNESCSPIRNVAAHKSVASPTSPSKKNFTPMPPLTKSKLASK